MSCLNINIGILGHVDSGKTTLAKNLSEIGSTAAFDKSRQSQERGITLDLGFSALRTSLPPHFNTENSQDLQLTFVDCPGHASLLKTIIGGAQIIDFIILVVDVTKGIQTQTAECLVIGEITCPGKLLIALNKIDLLEDGPKRPLLIEKMTKKLKIVLSTTSFKEAKIVPVSATSENKLTDFLEVLKNEISMPIRRNIDLPFLFAVDHCFQITGQGTVCTGTILQGQISVGDEVEIPKMGLSRKVKSMQMYRKGIRHAMQGDRVGICLTQFSHSDMERGILAAPGFLRHIYVVVLKIHQIKYFKQTIKAKSKLHMSIGHETVLGKVLFYTKNEDNQLLYKENLEPETQETNIFAIIEFEKPVLVAKDMLVIASNLTEVHKNSCRLAFYGFVEQLCDDREYSTSFLPKFQIFKEKMKTGNIQRVVNDNEIIGINLFKKESDRQLYIGLKIELTTGETGVIEGTFGQTNKIKIRLNHPLSPETQEKLEKREEVRILLKFKKFIFEKTNNKRIRQ
ncbi:selenocysteine-specific elongation factor [Culicoides brevitarsis]|uniref:selenocysteine-specific elongation factor n=1 Tax=Culicoides brevitarsis TaxID=469753 RepID=UPI00307B14AC